MIVFDEISGFDGKMDRFDFKLVGKKEMLVPYNNLGHHNASLSNIDTAMLKEHVNPDVMRWELHRVWVVEATRKPGARHIYSKKVWLDRRGQLGLQCLPVVRRCGQTLPRELLPDLPGV